MRAGFVVGLLGLAGAFLQGANVTEAVGTELLVGAPLTPAAAIVGLLTAAVLVAIGVFAGYPIATAFTVTGAVVGAGLALGRGPAVPKYQEIATLWVLVPFVGGGIAYATARFLRNDRVPEPVAVPVLAGLVGVVLAHIEFVLLGEAGEALGLAAAVARALLAGPAVPTPQTLLAVKLAVTLAFALLVAGALRWDITNDPEAGQRHFLLVLGGLVAFSAGGSQVGLALGPLLPLLGPDSVSVPLTALLFAGGLGLLAGSWTGAPRMIKALAQDYSSLGPRRSIAALIPSFAIAQTAVFVGVPVSFNEIIVSAIIGSGYAAGGAGVSVSKMGYTVLAWLGSLVLAFGVSYGLFLAVSAVL